MAHWHLLSVSPPPVPAPPTTTTSVPSGRLSPYAPSRSSPLASQRFTVAFPNAPPTATALAGHEVEEAMPCFGFDVACPSPPYSRSRSRSRIDSAESASPPLGSIAESPDELPEAGGRISSPPPPRHRSTGRGTHGGQATAPRPRSGVFLSASASEDDASYHAHVTVPTTVERLSPPIPHRMHRRATIGSQSKPNPADLLPRTDTLPGTDAATTADA
jgi:hypothetical protein